MGSMLRRHLSNGPTNSSCFATAANGFSVTRAAISPSVGALRRRLPIPARGIWSIPPRFHRPSLGVLAPQRVGEHEKPPPGKFRQLLRSAPTPAGAELPQCRMAEDEGDLFIAASVGEPVPVWCWRC